MISPETEAKILEQLEAIGETEARKWVRQGKYQNANLAYVNHWLDSCERERSEAATASHLEAATSAASAALDQASAAREANDLARLAITKADTANNIAITSMVIAAISMVVAVIAYLFRQP